MNKTPNTPTPTKAFRKGLREVKVGDVDKVREDLKSALGVTTRQSLAAYADGKRLLDVETAARIEAVFLKYGVSACWGE